MKRRREERKERREEKLETKRRVYETDVIVLVVRPMSLVLVVVFIRS